MYWFCRDSEKAKMLFRSMQGPKLSPLAHFLSNLVWSLLGKLIRSIHFFSGTFVDYHVWDIRLIFRHWILWWGRSDSVLVSLFITCTLVPLIFKKHTFLLKSFVGFPEGLVQWLCPPPNALWGHFRVASVLFLVKNERNPSRCSWSLCHDPAYAGKSPFQVRVMWD